MNAVRQIHYERRENERAIVSLENRMCKGHGRCVYHPNMTHLFSLYSLLLKLKQIIE